MGRMSKTGLDWFKLLTKTNKDVDEVIGKFGLEGFGALIRLYQHIYTDGYYTVFDVGAFYSFSNINNIDPDRLSEIILFCFGKNLFNRQIYSRYRILTGRRIQENYFDVAKRRWNNVVYQEILLVSPPKDAEVRNIPDSMLKMAGQSSIAGFKEPSSIRNLIADSGGDLKDDGEKEVVEQGAIQNQRSGSNGVQKKGSVDLSDYKSKMVDFLMGAGVDFCDDKEASSYVVEDFIKKAKYNKIANSSLINGDNYTEHLLQYARKLSQEIG